MAATCAHCEAFENRLDDGFALHNNRLLLLRCPKCLG